MNKKDKHFLNLFLRYFILILIGFFGLNLFYKILTPLTSYSVYFILNIFLQASISNNFITITNGPVLELIPACIAGAAYYFLLILNLSIPNIKIKKELKMILFSFIILFLFNTFRIILLGFLLFFNSGYFDIIHKVFWYFLSILLIILIWFLEVKLFKIKSIPFYTDLKFLYKNSSLKK